MKYGYLKRCLCISIATVLIGTGQSSLLAEDLLTAGQEETQDDTAAGSEGEIYVDSDSYEEEESEESEDSEDSEESDEEEEDEEDEEEEDEDGEKPALTPTPSPSNTDTPGAAPSPSDPAVTPTPGGENPDAAPAQEDAQVTPTPSAEDPGADPSAEDPEDIITPDPMEEAEESAEEVLDPENPEEALAPDDPEVTPSITPTPTVEPEEEEEAEDPEMVESIIGRIDALIGVDITLDMKDEIEGIRAAYEALSEADRARISNYDSFLEIEEKLAALSDSEEEDGELDDGAEKVELESDELEVTAISGTPVYYTNMVSNLHAGKDFYLKSLKENYQIGFSEDFGKVMDEIEAEYKEANHLQDKSDVDKSLTTTSGDTLLVRNWQDILAIYIYEQSKEGRYSYQLNADSKERLAEIFAEMNPVVKSKYNANRDAYGDRHINYYIKKNNIQKDDREILRKYVETDCKLLCAVVTAAKGFVRESVGEDVSEERVNVISAAYSLVGKVGYFWGGKSVALGEDPNWGNAEVVTAEGSKSTGTTRAYGLDCSGFVTWAVVNGYQDESMENNIGDGTSEQWLNANVVSESDAQPGDLVFQKGPEAGQDNHVGILCGKTDAGDWIAVHCSSGKNGVTVGEAYGASFRYIRQPDFYPTDEEIADMLSDDLTDGTENDEDLTVTIESSFNEEDVLGSDESSSDDSVTSDAQGDEEEIIDGTEQEILIDDSVVEFF